MKKYIIVQTNGNFVDLARFVNQAMENGYVPTGGPFPMGGDGCLWWGQAMVLK